MNIARKLGVASAAFAIIAATPALAEPINLGQDDIGSSFSLTYDGSSDGNTIGELTSDIMFTLTGTTGDSYTFDYLVANTTSGDLTSNVSGFAFNTDPDISGASSTGDYSFNVIDSKYPNGIGSVDVCFKSADSNSCAGNGGGVSEGSTGSGSFTLNFDQIVESISLSDFLIRYQGITGAGNVTSATGTGTVTSSTGTSTSSGGTPVPEPGMLGLFGAGLIGLGLMRNRRRRSPRMALAAA